MEDKKEYTNEEKIIYFERKIMDLCIELGELGVKERKIRFKIERARKRLKELQLLGK